MIMTNKETVINPIGYFTTIREEIEDLLSSRDISIDSFLYELGWDLNYFNKLKKVTKSQALLIENILGVSNTGNYLINFQEQYRIKESSANQTYKKNVKIYKKLSHLAHLLRNDFNEGMDLLEDISTFLEIQNEDEIFERVKDNIALYKLTGFEADSLNLYSWLKRGEHDFRKKKVVEYSRNSFLNWINSHEWKKNLYNEDYIYRIPKLLEEFGVVLVYTPFLDKTVFGAVRWFDNRPLVQVSDRGKCMATFWYTLFHEFGHVIKHENDEIFEGTLDLPKSKINQKEKEANSFAYDLLFNGDGLRKFIFNYKGKFVDENFIYETSKMFKTDKMFTAFWMKKAQIKSKTIKENIPTLQFR